MSAFRGINLRSGDLAEQLGLLLLQNLALIAPVPRTEDVGIDAVATLIRKDGVYKYLAEDNFFVQIKSASVSSIKYSGKQVEWLYALELPYFVASVDRTISKIDLFCAHRLSDAFITNHERESVEIFLDDNNIDDEFVGKSETEVHIGPPVMTWSIRDLEEDKDLPTKFYDVVKSHVALYKSSLKTRDVGWLEYVAWTCNEPARRVGYKSASSRTPHDSLENAYDKMMPFFFVWQQELMRTKNWSAAQDVVSLLEKTKELIDMLNSKPS